MYSLWYASSDLILDVTSFLVPHFNFYDLVSHLIWLLIFRWRKTGTVKPEKIGGSRPKKVLPTVANAITVYKSWLPRLQSWQIKECLIRDGICTANNVPSVSSINKYIHFVFAIYENKLRSLFRPNRVKNWTFFKDVTQ